MKTISKLMLACMLPLAMVILMGAAPTSAFAFCDNEGNGWDGYYVYPDYTYEPAWFCNAPPGAIYDPNAAADIFEWEICAASGCLGVSHAPLAAPPVGGPREVPWGTHASHKAAMKAAKLASDKAAVAASIDPPPLKQ
jgi:hypothetical protein